MAYVVEEEYPNGTAALYGPIWREPRALKVFTKIKEQADNRTKVSLRQLTPWRAVLKSRRAKG